MNKLDVYVDKIKFMYINFTKIEGVIMRTFNHKMIDDKKLLLLN